MNGKSKYAGSAGVGTGLAPSMTIGTGFFGRSSVGENLQPKHLVQWTRLAYNEDPAVGFADFTGLVPWETPGGVVPPYPVASNLRDAEGARRAGGPGGADPDVEALRAEIRRVVLEELRGIVRGQGG